MKKALIITYYWPPAGGPGVLRWLYFVKYLKDFDIIPVVFIPEHPKYAITDASLEKEISEDVTIYRQKIFEPYGIASIFSKNKTAQISSGIINKAKQSFSEKILLWIRGNCFVPDARKFWVRPSVKAIGKIIKKEDIHTIITTGPPHSVHLIGLGLKKRHQLQWIADFRDPWTSIGYHKHLKLTKASQRRHKFLEREVLANADKIVVTSRTTRKEFEAITEKPIRVITNGYDLGNELRLPTSLDKKFTLSHIGSLLSGRNPKNLWQVLAELIKENEAFRRAFKLQLVGVISNDVLETIYSSGLKEFTMLEPYVSHQRAIEYQQASQVLLLAEIDSEETKGIIPGKLFEYMMAQRPILAIGPKDWEAANLVTETRTGEVFEYDSRSQLKKILIHWFQLYQEGKLMMNSPSIEAYSRRALTQRLAKEIVWD